MLSRNLTRAPVFFSAIALLYSAAACTGPGLEPPETPGIGTGGHSGSMATGGVGGVSGTGGVGGLHGVTGGAGGVAAGAGGASGAGGTGNSGEGGAGGMSTGGLGGTGGMGGMGGSMSSDDAGTDEGAPVEACEQDRDIVMLRPGSCEITIPDDAVYGVGELVLAITDDEGTTIPALLDTSLMCPESDEVGFAYSNSFIPATLELCAATCAQVEGATVELIYGCIPPVYEP